MANRGDQAVDKTTFRVHGFSCAGCAATFESNVKKIDGVLNAKVNFGASKITVEGNATIEQLEKAGSFENLKVTTERERDIVSEKKSFWKAYAVELTSLLFVILGFISLGLYGEESLLTALVFVTAIVIGGFSLFVVGIKNLVRLQFDMRTLMTIAIIGAAIIGQWSEGAVVVILFAISEALERYSMDKARNSIHSLMDIAPKVAMIQRGGEEVLISVDDIQIGDTMIVKPGEKIAMDGIVMRGASSVNQAAITGESIPVQKESGDEVFAGSLNEEGLLVVEVTKLVDDTTIAKIIHLVEEAQDERAPSQAFVDRFAKYYTPAIMVIALLVAIIPPLLLNGEWQTWIYQGLAVLVVGCPCALVISTPVSIVTAIGNAARQGVLVKGGVYLEEAGALKAIAFDKTGTLTKGTPIVTDYIVDQNVVDSRELLSIAAALESRSQHPLASAIIKMAEVEDVIFKHTHIEDFTSITGKGIQGDIANTTYYIGNPKLFADLKSECSHALQVNIESLQAEGKTVMIIGTQSQMLGVIAVADEIRETSRHVVRKLHDLGIEKTVMLTGDNESTAHAIGREVGVAEIQAELLPQHKLEVIKQLQSTHGKVAMVGDGINDAPALAAATVGIAMGGAGTDTALETADIVLMADDLKKLPFTMMLSRKALIIIKQNISFSIGIKILALLLVVPGWLTLWIAILADVGATLLVTLNGLRLMKMKQ